MPTEPPQSSQPREQYGGEESWPPVPVTQPTQNMEVGDAVKASLIDRLDMDELAKVLMRWGSPHAGNLKAYRDGADSIISHLRLALSVSGKRYPDDPMESVKSNQKFRDANATRHDARGGDGELANKVKELLINHDNDDIKGINCHYCCSWREDAFKILKKNALAIIAASTNAERLRKIIKAAGEVSPAHMPLSLRNVLAEIGPLSPAQTPGDERQG